tara:strand:+ start:16120 stop:16677 length:558 start_codon:yes stop_codon:yes gene_type:complete
MLLGLAGLFSGEVAEAQPSGPPHRFAGTVTVDGEGAAAGTSVVAIVDGAQCGAATVLTGASGSTYALDVPATCASAGDAVTFQVGGSDAAEAGTWSGGGFTGLNLTVSTAVPEEPAEEASAGDDAAADDPSEPAEPDEAEDAGDPAVGDTGTGLATTTSTSLGAILGVMALAVMLGGYTYARRRS